MFGLMDTGCVQKYTLEIVFCQNTCDFISCSLGLIGRNGNLFPNEAVHQCRFPYVWSADERYKSRIKFSHSYLLTPVLLFPLLPQPLPPLLWRPILPAFPASSYTGAICRFWCRCLPVSDLSVRSAPDNISCRPQR